MYTFDSRVRYSETDERGRLSVTGIMNYLQDCSTFHSEDIGMGVGYLKEHHRAWWLSSWQIVIDRYPRLGETITVGTWPYDFRGMFGYRNFTIRDEGGKYLVRADSTWFLYDTEMGRPVRVQDSDIERYRTGDDGRLEMERAPKRIEIPGEYREAEAVTVSRCHIDTNHHVNNAQYVEIARELLPADFVIGELRVDYRKAAAFGDRFCPHVSRMTEGYVVSLCDADHAPYAVIWLRRMQRG